MTEKELIEKTEEIADARTDEVKEVKVKTESPLEEARRLKEELKEVTSNMSHERQRLELLRANSYLDGRSLAGKAPMSQEDIDQAEADAMIKRFS